MTNRAIVKKDRERLAQARSRGEAKAADPSAVLHARYDVDRDAINQEFRSGDAMTISRGVVPGLEDVPTTALETIRRAARW